MCWNVVDHDWDCGGEHWCPLGAWSNADSLMRMVFAGPREFSCECEPPVTSNIEDMKRRRNGEMEGRSCVS